MVAKTRSREMSTRSISSISCSNRNDCSNNSHKDTNSNGIVNDDGNDVLLGKLIGEGEEKDPNSDIFDSKSECVIRMAKGVVSRSNHITHITNRIMCVHRRCFLFFYLLVALVRKGS